MRSVARGAWPLDEQGSPIMFEHYQHAAPHLKQRLGRYCSFCERKVPASLAVEHKVPKAGRPDLAREWANLLLACSNCNSRKGPQQVNPDEIIWPDIDDTFNAIGYHRDGSVAPNTTPRPADRARAARLMSLCGLDLPMFSSPADHRWIDRLEIWSLAEKSLSQLRTRDTEGLREHIVLTAAAMGGFSIWMAVFRDDASMRAAFITAYPGTVNRGLEPTQNT